MAYLRAASVIMMITLSSALILGGCGGKNADEVVATFNGEPLTLGYLEAKWAKLAQNDPSFAPDPDNAARMDSLRHAVLDVIITKELIVDQAYKRKFIEDETYQGALAGQKDYRLIELLKNREVIAKIPEFTEEDYKSHYSLLGWKVKARHLDVDTEEEAKALVDRLRKGEITFEVAVRDYSISPDRDTGGNLGIVTFGTNIKPVEDTLFAMEQGDISDPIKTTLGFSIFIVDEKTYEDPPEYGSVRESIINRLKMRAMREAGAANAKEVMDKYKFKFNWDAAQVIFDHMPDDPSPAEVEQARIATQEKPILKLDEKALDMVLYEVEGEKHTLREFSDEFDRLHPLSRPLKQDRLQGIYNWVHRTVVNKLMPKEAILKGLDKDPEFVLIMKEFEEQSCIGAVRRAVVDAGVQITEDDVRKWYEENPKYYTLRPSMRCKQIVNAEEEKAKEAYRRLQAGEPADSVGADLSIFYPDKWLSEFFTPDSTKDASNDAMRYSQRLLKPGDFTPPFVSRGYWGILVLADTQPARLMAFEEAKERAQRDLQEIRSSERLDSLLTVWRGEADIVINEKVLRKAVKGPDPTPTQATM